MDLIRTIEENTEVQNYSEDSDAEVEVSDNHNLTFNETDNFFSTLVLCGILIKALISGFPKRPNFNGLYVYISSQRLQNLDFSGEP